MLFDRVAFDDYFQDAQAMAHADGTGTLGVKHVLGITQTVVEWIEIKRIASEGRAHA